MRRALCPLLISLSPSRAAQMKEKRTYELIYEDVQQLKQQYLRVEKKLDEAATSLKLLGDQIRDLSSQFKLFQTDQVGRRRTSSPCPSSTRSSWRSWRRSKPSF